MPIALQKKKKKRLYKKYKNAIFISRDDKIETNIWGKKKKKRWLQKQVRDEASEISPVTLIAYNITPKDFTCS